jgi:NSS family neurotransmitter:Na+ symporter
LLGCLCAISISNWENIEGLHKILISVLGVEQPSFFAFMDNLASNWLLPLGGLFIALFVGWVWGTRKAVDEIREGSHNFADVHLVSLLAGLKDDPAHNTSRHVWTLAALWGIFIRFISPVAVLIAFLHTIGWINIS